MPGAGGLNNWITLQVIPLLATKTTRPLCMVCVETALLLQVLTWWCKCRRSQPAGSVYSPCMNGANGRGCGSSARQPDLSAGAWAVCTPDICMVLAEWIHTLAARALARNQTLHLYAPVAAVIRAHARPQLVSHEGNDGDRKGDLRREEGRWGMGRVARHWTELPAEQSGRQNRVHVG